MVEPPVRALEATTARHEQDLSDMAPLQEHDCRDVPGTDGFSGSDGRRSLATLFLHTPTTSDSLRQAPHG